jgi:phage tail-like protein
MPGLPKYANITLKRGVMLNDNEFFEWVNTIHGGTVQRRDLTNSLLDETHTPTVTWKVKNAWPVKLTAPKLDAMEGRIAIETLEIAHEGLTVQTD